MRARVVREWCTGQGVCVSIAPDIFALDEDGKAYVINETTDDDKLREAAVGCPSDAIILEDELGNQLYP